MYNHNLIGWETKYIKNESILDLHTIIYNHKYSRKL